MNIESEIPLNTPGAVHIKVSEHIDKVFEMDTIASKEAPNILPLESKEELFNFLEVEHNAKTFVWNNKTGDMVGYLSYIDAPDEEGRVELLNLIVIPKHWRKGFGKKMVDYYHNLMRNKGYKKSKLVTNPENTQAINFYQKTGYVIQGVVNNYYGPGEDRVVMTFNL